MGLLGLTAIGGEFYARAQLQNMLDSAFAEAGVEASELEINRPGLLLGQLATGTIPQADLSAAALVFDGLEVSHVTATAQNISTSSPIVIGSVTARGEITAETLSTLGAQHGLPEMVNIVLADGSVYLEADLFGQKLRAGTTLIPGDREIGISVGSVSVGGIAVDLESWGIDVVQFFGAPTISLEALPKGLELTGISVEPSIATSSDSGDSSGSGGNVQPILAVTLTGTNLTLEQ